MFKIIEGFMAAITIPLILLKWLGWLFCAVWLLFVGDWRVVICSLIVGWIGSKILPLVNGIAAVPFFPLMIKFQRSPVLAGVLTIFARLPICALLIAWCVFCLIFVALIRGMSECTEIPRLLMSYCMAVHTIWNLTAENQRAGGGGVANFLCVMLCAVGYLIVVILLSCGVGLSLLMVIYILAGFLFVSVLFSVWEVVLISKATRELES